MKVTIVTVVRNQCAEIEDCVKSVLSQTHKDVEYIVIDGASTDGTLEILLRYQDRITKIVSEADAGLYDAMNKGLRLATGDIVGILNSDDFYEGPQVLERVVAAFRKCDAEALFADLVYVRPGNLERVVRFYSGRDYSPDKVARGWIPPHPTFFVRRELYERYGLFHADYRIAADFELMARFLVRHKVKHIYLPEVLVRMRTGGISTRELRSTWILNLEILRACAENGIPTSLLKVYSKYLRKGMQLFERPARVN